MWIGVQNGGAVDKLQHTSGDSAVHIEGNYDRDIRSQDLTGLFKDVAFGILLYFGSHRPVQSKKQSICTRTVLLNRLQALSGGPIKTFMSDCATRTHASTISGHNLQVGPLRENIQRTVDILTTRLE